jgi:uncharacterized protein
VEGHLPRELSTDECLELLGSVPLGRVGRNDPSGPSIVPVNFVVHRGGVLLRSLDGSKTQAADDAEPVSFEADGPDVVHRSGWSVLVRGRLRYVDVTADDLPDPDSFAAGADDDLLWLEPEQITGRRLPLTPAVRRSWAEIADNVWFGQDGSDLLG